MGKSDVFQDDGVAAMEKLSVQGISNDIATRTPYSSSSASSTTLAPSTDFTKPSNSLSSIQSGSGVTASLVLEGTRAIAAFCRPYPMATIGTPERIDFDIPTTNFRLQVRVRADDIAKTANGEPLATEVYVPFAHYAASLAPFDGVSDPADSADRYASKVSLLRDSANASPINGEPGSTRLKLDIDARVSSGKVTLSGQTLRWTYPIPSAGETVYTLEIKRRSGPMERNMGYVQQSGGWWEVCPSCVIA